MKVAYVLINCQLGAERDVANILKDMPGVAEVHTVYGIYDMIAKVVADTTEELNRIITWKIRRLQNVRSTVTMIVFESFGKATAKKSGS